MIRTGAMELERPLNFAGPLAWFLELVFLSTTFLLPIVAHLAGWSVFVALPMFWGVMLAGVVYGWKAGLLLGVVSPALNHLVTGMPVAPLVPVMTLELAIYGALPAALGTRVFRGNLFLGTAVAIVTGRVVLVGWFVLFMGGVAGLPGWFFDRLMPGVATQLIQIVAVPVLGSFLIRRIRKN